MRKILVVLIALLAAGAILCCSCEKEETENNEPFAKVDVSEKLVTNEKGSFEFYLSSNTSWEIKPQASWLHVSRPSGKNSMSIKVDYDANPDATGKREGTINIRPDGLRPVTVKVIQSKGLFKNPIFGSTTMPDPYIWRDKDGDGNVVYYTCKSSGGGIGISKSNKLTQVNAVNKVWSLPASGWNKRDLWAPELFHINDKNGDYWYVYYAAGNPEAAGLESGQYGSQRTGVLRATSPTGSYQDMGMIYTGDQPWHGGDNSRNTINNTIYAIDMTTFEWGGQRYAVWSGNINKDETVGGIKYLARDQAIYIATMENPWTINHARVELSRADRSWEMKSRLINEGPAMLFNPEKTKLFCVYSANASWDQNYCLGWLEFDLTGNPTVEDFLNPEKWKKSDNHVFYRNDGTTEASGVPGVNGVGHNCFTQSPDGTEDWIVYHEMKYKDGGWGERYPFTQKFTWDQNGRPVFGTPVSWGEWLDIPSGEQL